jgi:hypothetical protein
MEHTNNLPHEAIDRLMASVFGWCERVFSRSSGQEFGDVAFSDEWERKQIARELHWN